MKPNPEDIFLVYDGECPLCRLGANSFCVDEEAEAKLQRLNKRVEDTHLVIEEIRDHQLNLDRGMVLKYRGKLYQGAEALWLMSKLGKGNHWATRISKILFCTRLTAHLFYPFLRLARNILIRIKGVPPFNNLK